MKIIDSEMGYSKDKILQAVMVCDVPILKEVVENKLMYKVILNEYQNGKTIFTHMVNLFNDFPKIKFILLDLLECIDYKNQDYTTTNESGFIYDILSKGNMDVQVMLLDYFKEKQLKSNVWGLDDVNLLLPTLKNYSSLGGNMFNKTLFEITKVHTCLSIYWMDLLVENMNKEVIKNNLLINALMYNNLNFYSSLIKDVKKNKREFNDMSNIMMQFIYVLGEKTDNNSIMEVLGFKNKEFLNFDSVWSSLEKKIMDVDVRDVLIQPSIKGFKI